MAMRRTPSLPGFGRAPFRGALVPLLLLLALSLLVPGCQKDDDKLLKPGSVADNVVTAVYIPPDLFHGNEVKMDGDAKDREWGGPLDSARPYTQVRLTSEDGAGEPGDPIYVSMKAVYTDTDIFLLLRWADTKADAMKDPLYYVGPDLTDSTGCQNLLVAESSWSRTYRNLPAQDEDRLTLAFEMEPTGDNLGTYREQGCLVACHPNQNPQFGRPGYGRLDVWEWLACRTNLARNKYTDFDNADFPVYGIPGYLDDLSADPDGGLVPDPGRPCWLPNTFPGSNRPRWIYRLKDDPFSKPLDPNNCFSAFGEKCRINNGLPNYYIWREDIERIPDEFTRCDSMNAAVLPQGKDPRKWRPGDAVSAYFYTYPEGSRADLRGKGVYDDKTGLWTMEMARPLRTADAYNDLQFTGEPGTEFVFTVAVADNSARRHWGSGPQVLRFGSKARVSASAPGNGE
jgi:hypothetical protein